MSLGFVLESLKFYKVRHEWTMRIWFVILFLIEIAPFVLPIGDRDFSRLFAATEEMLGGTLPKEPIMKMLTPGNWLLIGLAYLTGLIALIFGYLYANLIVAESDGGTPRQALGATMRGLPRLLLLGLILLIPVLLSACFAFIPLIFVCLILYFVPLLLSADRLSLSASVRHSLERTKGRKLTLFFSVLMLSVLIGLPMNLFGRFLTGWPQLLVGSFFRTWSVFAQGRLMALLFLVLVRNKSFMLPSKKNSAA